MKRFLTLILGGILIASMSLSPKVANADVNNFYFSSFVGDYYLSKDSDGRSTMKVVEHLTAEFPTTNQNKGIERAIPEVYDGHKVSFKLISLTRNGQTEPVFSTTHKSGNVVIGTGTNDYVTGTQVYEFTYTLRDVTKDFGNSQELYWDTNGTEWSQRFDNVTANVHLDSSVSDLATGGTKCYEGSAGSTTKCQNTGSSTDLSFYSNGTINAGSNLSFVVEFKPSSFNAIQLSPLDYITYILAFIPILTLIYVLYLKYKYGRDFKGKGTIIPEYIPPKGESMYVSANMMGYKYTNKALPAQIIDLAVRHKINVIESNTKILWATTKTYTLEVVSVEGMDEYELQIMNALFNSNLQPGARKEMTKRDTTLAITIGTVTKLINKSILGSGYRQVLKSENRKKTIIVIIPFILALVIMFMSSNSYSIIQLPPVLQIAMMGSAIISIIFGFTPMNPLTEKGRTLKDYLEGLKMYIKYAEVDRLKALQSPDGALKTQIDPNDKQQVVKLYERVLPYAVLFNQEKEWSKQLAVYYQETNLQPNWYIGGVAGFNAATFADTVSGFTSFAAPTNSSGSGMGGGFSGGGGGGGGGGGR
jgi:uncharacterized membrane protein YgcG